MLEKHNIKDFEAMIVQLTKGIEKSAVDVRRPFTAPSATIGKELKKEGDGMLQVISNHKNKNNFSPVNSITLKPPDK